MKKLLFILWLIFCISARGVFSQSQTSKDNYTGAWETPASWNPEWTLPQTTNIAGMDIIINGYITVNGSLSFSGSPANLIINDTLVIKGDLSLGSYNNLTINGNGILIIRGNLILDNNFNIITNNYIVISGYMWKTGSNNTGSFVSNSNPTKVFVGAYVYPAAITNKPNFPALNCTAPITTPYLHSKCSYGDVTDILNDPINSFFQTTCIMATPTITAGGPTTFCASGSVTLTSSAGTSYLWSTGATTASINATSSGSYSVKVTNTSGCQSAASVASIVTVNALPATPIITADGPTTFCRGDSVTLTSSTGTSYLWTNAATTPSINVSAAGNYSVQVTDANGCKSAPSVATIVNINALPAVFAGTDATIPNGTSTTINATVTGTGPFTYIWSPSAQLVDASLEDPTTTNLITSTVFTLKATSTTTSCSDRSSVTITISGGPLRSTPTAIPGTVCAGTNVQLNALAGGGSGSYSYTWTSTPAGFTSSVADPIANPMLNTTYNVAVFDGFTTVNSNVIVTVNALPATPTITNDGPTTFCAGGSVTLTSSAETGYLWSNGATTASINTTISGDYTIQVTNANGCQSASLVPMVVTVNALPVIPTITAAGPTAFCVGGNVTLTSSKESGYFWSNGATTPDINVTTAGNYTVKVTNASGCQSETSVATVVTVNALPVTPIIIALGPTTFCAGGSVTLTSNTGISYLWSDGATTPHINVTTTGIYTGRLTNANGCSVTDSINVIVNENPIADAGPDTLLKFVFETTLKAKLSSSETGEWSLISGSGLISATLSPVTKVTKLSGGENIFLWKVQNFNCKAVAKVKITVYDPFIPSVITPNGDGKNDYFVIGEIISKVELIIFNKWGNEEYTNRNYLNDWDGRNNKGGELPNDTYFYILKFENVKIKKGSVIIKR